MPDTRDKPKKEYVRQGELADLSGLRQSTIKYYTELGLLPHKQEAEGLNRFYEVESSLKRLEEIAELKEQSKSITEILEHYIT